MPRWNIRPHTTPPPARQSRWVVAARKWPTQWRRVSSSDAVGRDVSLYADFWFASNHHICQVRHAWNQNVRLMRGFAEWPAAAVDKSRLHAGGFRADAVEGVIGDKQDLLGFQAEKFGGFGVSRHVRLERIRHGHRDDSIEGDPVILLCRL